MPNLKNLVALCVFLWLVPTMYDVVYQIVGPNTVLYNYTNSSITGVAGAPQPAVFLPNMMFAIRWSFRLAAIGILIWGLAASEKEEPYDQGF